MIFFKTRLKPLKGFKNLKFLINNCQIVGTVNNVIQTQNEKTEKTKPPKKSHYSDLKAIFPNDMYVSCSILNIKGDIVAISKKFPKIEFLKQNKLFLRDLRKIDTSCIDVLPSITVRSKTAILVNLLHIKAIIHKNSVSVFDTSISDIATRLGVFIYDLEMKLRTPSETMCYEFRALESVFDSVLNCLKMELKRHKEDSEFMLKELEEKIERKEFEILLTKLKELKSFFQKSLLIRNVLNDLLDNNDDMSGMHLTENNHKINSENIDSLEMMLETYYNLFDEVVQQGGSLINDIEVTEEILNTILDSNRNSLMILELKIAIYTLGITSSTLIPAFYGMNVINHVDKFNLSFFFLVFFSIFQGILLIIFNLHVLFKIQKVSTSLTANVTVSFYQYIKSFFKSKFFNQNKWYYKLIFGRKIVSYVEPTLKEKEILQKMINERITK